ncbi:P-loop NTPase [Nocardioides sp. InS609-2]|uniref:AAA family ATPase n=1 Tax=Nocardioides sp. InS609-2 TaxID=2760705 RepID=UPI0020BE7FCC|nr:P-loop NTPase [Nocardioides sp. InS609-2]
MPLAVDPEPSKLSELLKSLPPGGNAVDTTDRVVSWLDQRAEEYALVLGPNVPLEEALSLADTMRIQRPMIYVVLVREVVDTEVLTRAMHSGVREVVADGDMAAIGYALDRAQEVSIALRGDAPAGRLGKVLTVFSPKGGVGKTTMSVNLALALAGDGFRKVCLVDMDLAFGDVAITLQLFPTHSVEHLIGSEDSLDFPLVESMLTKHESGLMVLAAPSLPDARDRVTGALVSRLLKVLQEQFDYIVVDSAPTFDEQTLTALDGTDECVIVATLDVPTLKNVRVALDTLDMLSIAVDHRHLLLNRADDQVGLGADKVESILGMEIAAQVPSSIDIAAATNAGLPIVLSSPDHQSSRVVRALATRLTGEVMTSTDDVPSGGSRRFRKRR